MRLLRLSLLNGFPPLWLFLRNINFLLFKQYGKNIITWIVIKSWGEDLLFLTFVKVDVQFCCWSEVCLKQVEKAFRAMCIHNQSLCTCTTKYCMLLMTSNLSTKQVSSNFWSKPVWVWVIFILCFFTLNLKIFRF